METSQRPSGAGGVGTHTNTSLVLSTSRRVVSGNLRSWIYTAWPTCFIPCLTALPTMPSPIMPTFIRQDYNKSFDRPSSARRPMPLGEFRKYGGGKIFERVVGAHICGVGRIERQGAQMRVGAIDGESAANSLKHHLV